MRFRVADNEVVDDEVFASPRVIFGLHACDINGLLKLDKVFTKEFFPSPYYISRRKNTFIVGMDHEPCSDGFCRSLGTDTVRTGFDLFLTDLGDRYFVTINSDRGYSGLQLVSSREITDADTHDYLEVRKRIAERLLLGGKVETISYLRGLSRSK